MQRSDYLHDLLRGPLRSLPLTDAEYSDTFDALEYLLGVACTHVYGRGPLGRFVWRRRYETTKSLQRVVDEYEGELLGAGLFGGDVEQLHAARDRYEEEITQSGLAW